jgi:hypothetical protein
MDRTEIAKKNLDQLLELRGMTSYELSTKLKFYRTYFNDFLTGRKMSIKPDAVLRASRMLNCDVGYLFGAKELPEDASEIEPFQTTVGLASDLLKARGYEPEFAAEQAVAMVDGRRIASRNLEPGTIPEIDTRLGAGGGGYPLPAQVNEGSRSYTGDTVRAEWRMPTSFLREELHVSLSSVDIAPVFGDSMTDERGGGFRDGDRVLINRGDQQLRQGGIFAVRDEDETIIKQVELVRGSDPPRIICTSLNPRYQPFELVLDGSAEIIGRVVLKISRV